MKNEIRLIDGDKLLKDSFSREFPYKENGTWFGENYILVDDIKNAPTIDAVPVVRCKDCKYWANGFSDKRPCRKTDAYPILATDFCSYGEKKDGKIE